MHRHRYSGGALGERESRSSVNPNLKIGPWPNEPMKPPEDFPIVRASIAIGIHRDSPKARSVSIQVPLGPINCRRSTAFQHKSIDKPADIWHTNLLFHTAICQQDLPWPSIQTAALPPPRRSAREQTKRGGSPPCQAASPRVRRRRKSVPTAQAEQTASGSARPAPPS
jgi:hypothetical protein